MSSDINLQDKLLNTVRKKNITVTIYLTNGFQLKGQVNGFDNFTILLDSEGETKLIYKHAISTVIPAQRVNNLFERNNSKNNNDEQ